MCVCGGTSLIQQVAHFPSRVSHFHSFLLCIHASISFHAARLFLSLPKCRTPTFATCSKFNPQKIVHRSPSSRRALSTSWRRNAAAREELLLLLARLSGELDASSSATATTRIAARHSSSSDAGSPSPTWTSALRAAHRSDARPTSRRPAVPLSAPKLRLPHRSHPHLTQSRALDSLPPTLFLRRYSPRVGRTLRGRLRRRLLGGLDQTLRMRQSRCHSL